MLLLAQIMYSLMANERAFLENVVRGQVAQRAVGAESSGMDAPSRAACMAALKDGCCSGEAIRAYLLSLSLAITTTVLGWGVVLPSYKVVADIEGEHVVSASHSVWSGAKLLSNDNTFGFDNSGLRVLTLAMIVGIAAAQQALLLIVWFVPLSPSMRSKLRATLKIIADWSSLETYLAALYVLRCQLGSMVDELGGQLVTKYGLMLSLESDPLSIHLPTGGILTIADPLLLLFLVALANELLLHFGVLRQTAQEAAAAAAASAAPAVVVEP